MNIEIEITEEVLELMKIFFEMSEEAEEDVLIISPYYQLW